MKLSLRIQAFLSQAQCRINIEASARCKQASGMGKLFQQFIRCCGKPLKRLVSCEAPTHRPKAAVLLGICHKLHKVAIPTVICFLALTFYRTDAQSADDFFHSGARSYLTNNVAGAQKEVDQGLKLFPDDIKLKKLDELLKQQQQQQQQQNQQQNQQQQQNQSQQNQSKQNQQQQKSQQQKQNEELKQQDQNKQQQEQQKQAEQQKEKEQEQQAQAREMTPEQAKQLMDQQKANEMLLPASRREKPRNQEGPIKDW